MADEHGQRQISSWSDLFMRTFELGLGAATLTLDAAQHLVNELVGHGQVPREESASLVDRLMDLGRQQRDQLMEMIEKGSERAMTRMDLARRSELEALRKRVAELERTVLGYSTPLEEPIPPFHGAEMDEAD